LGNNLIKFVFGSTMTIIDFKWIDSFPKLILTRIELKVECFMFGYINEKWVER
jgi:hypothetical protein